jgi:hypothetical protein
MTNPPTFRGAGRFRAALATIAAEFDALLAACPPGPDKPIRTIDDLGALAEACLPEAAVRVLVSGIPPIEAPLIGAVTDGRPDDPGTVWLIVGERAPVDPAAWAGRRPARR